MKTVEVNGKMYYTKIVYRFPEGANMEEDEYETAYIVLDENGELIWDTTNFDNVAEYFEDDMTVFETLQLGSKEDFADFCYLLYMKGWHDGRKGEDDSYWVQDRLADYPMNEFNYESII